MTTAFPDRPSRRLPNADIPPLILSFFRRFAAGLHLGPTIIHPSSASLLPTDGTAWETYNNLARGHGVGIGFGQARSAGWVGDVLGVGAAAVGLAGRVPT